MLYVGVGGVQRNATVAACTEEGVLAVCQQERLTRVRGVGLRSGELPAQAAEEVLRLAGQHAANVDAYVVAEEFALPSALPVVRLAHHFAHAATAFFTSGFERAAIVVCDHHSSPEITVWLGNGNELRDQHWPASSGLARLYSACADVLMGGSGQEDALEALARVGRVDRTEDADRIVRYIDGTFQVHRDCLGGLRALIDRSHGSSIAERARNAAATVQQLFGKLLLQFIADVRAAVPADSVCLGGGLFFNTYFNAQVAGSDLYNDVFVPVNPGNGGLAVGNALAMARQSNVRPPVKRLGSFLGPSYDLEEIKAILDNCKLSYECLTDSDVIAASVEALKRGLFVGWFQGRMEWGRRALGARSIVADPGSPYVLENLNRFLKRRPPYWAYGLCVAEEDLRDHFEGPPHARFMEHDFAVRNLGALGHVLPEGATSLRVQSVGDEPDPFCQLLRAMAQAGRSGLLINTSFNGFHEPIVCTPRDAVRVFFGSGLDVLILERFVIRK